jgi:hypothetical protein
MDDAAGQELEDECKDLHDVDLGDNDRSDG